MQALMTGQMTDLTGKIQAQKDDVSADVFAADAAFMFKKKIAQIRSEAAANTLGAKKDLTEQTEGMCVCAVLWLMLSASSSRAARPQRGECHQHRHLLCRIPGWHHFRQGGLLHAPRYPDQVVAANHKSVESGFEVLTGVIRDFKEQGGAERALNVKQNAALAADMQKVVIFAIQDGEAKAVADRSRARLVAAENSMLVEYETNVYTEFTRKDRPKR